MKLSRAKDEMLKVLCLLYSQKIFREFKFNKNLRLTYLRKTLNAYFFNAIWLAWPFTPNKIMILNMIRFDAGTKSLKKTSLYCNIILSLGGEGLGWVNVPIKYVSIILA